MKKILQPLFYITAIYSFIALPMFAEKTGGACNAGAALFGIGLFLIICCVLTFIAIRNSAKRSGKIFSCISLLIWGFWMVAVCVDSPKAGIIYFAPLFITILVTVCYSFGERQVKNSNQEK